MKSARSASKCSSWHDPPIHSSISQFLNFSISRSWPRVYETIHLGDSRWLCILWTRNARLGTKYANDARCAEASGDRADPPATERSADPHGLAVGRGDSGRGFTGP